MFLALPRLYWDQEVIYILVLLILIGFSAPNLKPLVEAETQLS